MRKDSTSYGAERPSWDKADCSVRALAAAAGVSYKVASITFSAQGRTLKKGTSIELSRRLYEDVLGMKPVDMAQGMHLGGFLEVARTGSFLIHKNGHAFAVVEGVVHDWEGTSKDSTRIVKVWKVTEVARVKMAKMALMVEGL